MSEQTVESRGGRRGLNTRSTRDLNELHSSLIATVPVGSLIDLFQIRLDRLLTGAAQATMTVNTQHLNQRGAAQAGSVVALADAAAGWATHTLLDVGEAFSTLELKTNLFRPATQGSTLLAEATALHAGKSTISVAVDVYNQKSGSMADMKGSLLAHFLCTQYVSRT